MVENAHELGYRNFSNTDISSQLTILVVLFLTPTSNGFENFFLASLAMLMTIYVRTCFLSYKKWNRKYWDVKVVNQVVNTVESVAWNLIT